MIINAKYAGACRVCGEAIEVNEEIVYNKELTPKTAHVACVHTKPVDDPDAPIFFDDWASLEKPIEWLIDERLQVGGAMLIAAESKAGKSTMVGDLIRALLIGGEWLGSQVKASKVLYCVFDEPVETLRERFVKLGISLPHPNLKVINRPPSDGFEKFVTTAWEVSGADVLVSDTLFDLLSISGEHAMNSYGVIKPALTRLRTIANGKSQIWITHANKGGNNGHSTAVSIRSVIGSGAFAASADTILMLEADKSGDRFVSTRQRRGKEINKTLLVWDDKTGHVSLGASGRIVQVERAKHAILSKIDARYEGSREELAVLSGAQVAIGRAAVDLLEQDKILEISGAGTRGNPKTYHLAGKAHLRLVVGS
jgi:hypothetical protein